MPDLTVTDDQRERLRSVADDLAEIYVEGYGTVRPQDALEYLLDTYTPPECADGGAAGERDGTRGAGAANDGSDGDAADSDDGGDADAAEGDSDETAEASCEKGPAAVLRRAQDLLADNDDRWRESGGEAPYEVDLPDGGTEPARTKDDVKRLLFRHYR